MSDSIKELTEKILAFSHARGWEKFPNVQKPLAISLSLEASELLEHFQWVEDRDVAAHVEVHCEEIAEELADVLIYALQFAHHCKIDIGQAIQRKMQKNAEKYPLLPKG